MQIQPKIEYISNIIIIEYENGEKVVCNTCEELAVSIVKHCRGY